MIYFSNDHTPNSVLGWSIDRGSVRALRKKLTVEEHLAARWCLGAKVHSPYTRFGEKDGVMETFGQGNGLALRIEGLRKAIASGDVHKVRIYEHFEVMKSIEKSRFHAPIKKKLSTWAKAHHEVL